MSRFSRYDTDDERLPEGMTRVGYDADAQTYTFQDSDGSYWSSAPGNQYGILTRCSEGGQHEAADTEPFLTSDEPLQTPSWRRDMMPLLQFGVIVGLFLMLLFWYLGVSDNTDSPGKRLYDDCPENGTIHTIVHGDTCWDLAEVAGTTVEALTNQNKHLDCSNLQLESSLCLVPARDPVR